MENEVYEGKIKVFEPGKNYGFISTGNTEVFFHVSELQDSISRGDQVQFKLGSFKQRSCAIEIQKIE